MKDELDDKGKDYCSIPHEENFHLLSTMEAKDNRKRAAAQIKILAASKSAPANYDRDTSSRMTRNNKSRTDVLPDLRHKVKNNPKHSGYQCY